MKNPRWKRDEVILLVDFYFKFKIRECEPIEENLILLRKYILNLKCHNLVEIGDNFRNISGLKMKLYNLRGIDEKCNLPSLSNSSILDKEIFNLYKDNLEQLAREAYKLYWNNHLN